MSNQSQLMRQKYTSEAKNIALSNASEVNTTTLLQSQTTGPWWDLLAELDVTVGVSREYEHFIVLLSSDAGKPVISPLELPHPSGMFFDKQANELIVSSTRTPNQIFWMRPLGEKDLLSDVVPADMEMPHGTMFLPYRSILLPGTFCIHDIAMMGGELYATITGHNFLAKLGASGGWERVWWPSLLDDMGRAAFDQNYLQLNSIAVGTKPEDSFFTAFSDQPTGPKPWKDGYGPKGKGVVFSGATRKVMVRGLTCPHSAKLHQDRLWLCNSGYGEIGFADLSSAQPEFQPVAKANGFTRGLAIHGNIAFVGLSAVISFYEPYAPGLDPKKTECGIVAIDLNTGEQVAALTWDQGYQIYDVQLLPGVKRSLLPNGVGGDGSINKHLRFLG